MTKTENDNWVQKLSDALKEWDLNKAEALLSEHSNTLDKQEREGYNDQIKGMRAARELCVKLNQESNPERVEEFIEQIKQLNWQPPEFQPLYKEKLREIQESVAASLAQSLASVENLLKRVQQGHPEDFDEAMQQFEALPSNISEWPEQLSLRYIECEAAIEKHREIYPLLKEIESEIRLEHWSNAREILIKLEKIGESSAQLETYRKRIEHAEAHISGYSRGVGGGQQHDILMDLTAIRNSARAVEDYRGVLNANIALIFAIPSDGSIEVDGVLKTRDDLDVENDQLRQLLEQKIQSVVLSLINDAKLALKQGSIEQAERSLSIAEAAGEPDKKKLWGLQDYVGSITLPQNIQDDIEKLRRDIENQRASRQAAEREYEAGKEAIARGTLEGLQQALQHYETAIAQDETYVIASRAKETTQKALERRIQRERDAVRFAFDRSLQNLDFDIAEQAIHRLQSFEEPQTSLVTLEQKLDQVRTQAQTAQDIYAEYSAQLIRLKASLNVGLESELWSLLKQWRHCAIAPAIVNAEEQRLQMLLKRCRGYQTDINALNQAIRTTQDQVSDEIVAQLRQAVDADPDWKSIASNLGRYFLVCSQRRELQGVQIQSYLIDAKYYASIAVDNTLEQEISAQIETQAKENKTLAVINSVIDSVNAYLEYKRYEDALKLIQEQEQHIQDSLLRQKLQAEDALFSIQDQNAVENAKTALQEGRYQDTIQLLEQVHKQNAKVSGLLEQARSEERSETNQIQSLNTLRIHNDWRGVQDRIKQILNPTWKPDGTSLGQRLKLKCEELKSEWEGYRIRREEALRGLQVTVPDLVTEGQFERALSFLQEVGEEFQLLERSEYRDLEKQVEDAQRAEIVAQKHLDDAYKFIKVDMFYEASDTLSIPEGTPRVLRQTIEYFQTRCLEYIDISKTIECVLQAVIKFLPGTNLELSERAKLDEALQRLERARKKLTVLQSQNESELGEVIPDSLSELFEYTDRLQLWVTQVKKEVQDNNLETVATSLGKSLGQCPPSYPNLRTALEEFGSGWLQDRRDINEQIERCENGNYPILWFGDKLINNISTLSEIADGKLFIGGQPTFTTSWEKKRAGEKLEELKALERNRPIKTLIAYSSPPLLFGLIILAIVFLPKFIPSSTEPLLATPTVTPVIVTEQVIIEVTSTPTVTPTPTPTPTPIPPQDITAEDTVQLRESADGKLIGSYVTPGNHYMVNGWCELSGDHWLRIPYGEEYAWVRMRDHFNIQAKDLKSYLEIDCTTP